MTDPDVTESLHALENSLIHNYPVYDYSTMYNEGLTPLIPTSPQLYSWKLQYVFKLGGTKYEMNMIHLAGECSVPVVGQVVQNGKQVGFLMNKEKSLDASQLPKRPIMEMMRGVVEELHGKGIIHGDIKLPNILLCSDGKIRLCDFAGAFLKKHSGNASPVYTIPYLSPYRALHLKGPYTVEDDLFALGVSLWELFTGKTPFQGMKVGAIRRLIQEGHVVDLSEIEDDDAIHVAEELMSFMLKMTLKEDAVLEI